MPSRKTDKPVEAEVNQEAAEALEAAQKANEAAEAKPVSAWDKKVRMIVPRKPRGEDQQYYICVNDIRYAVPANGLEQELPLPVAEILRDHLAMEANAEDYAEHIPNYGNGAPTPHPIG